MRTYTLTVEDDGTTHSQTSKAIGYNSLELLGILYLELENVRQHYVMEPDKAIREKIETEGVMETSIFVEGQETPYITVRTPEEERT